MKSHFPSVCCASRSVRFLPSCLSLLALIASAHAAVSTANLRCEYLTNPRGVDTVAPRLSWIVEALERGERQTAWQVLVASTPALLAQDRGDLWDSGKVPTDQTSQIVYAGSWLGSRSECFWKVRSWDKAGEPSAWSKPASWTVGLLDETEWVAKWIDAGPIQRVNVTSPPVITRAAYEAVDGAGSLDVTARLRHMGAEATSFSVDVKNESFGGDPALNHVKRLRVEYETGGIKTVRYFAEKTTLNFPKDLPEPPSITRAVYEAVEGDGSLDVTDLLRKNAEPGFFEIPVSNDSFGTDPAPERKKNLRVEYIAHGNTRVKLLREGGTLHFPSDLLQSSAVPHLRRAFSTAKPVAKATVYATALGIYELRLNGQRVGDHFLAPEWTDYSKRLRYQEYDVTSLLAAGKNVLGARVANGWYSGTIGNGGFQYWGKSPALLVQLEITYKDGSSERIVTDRSWKSFEGPLVATDFMLGEDYDARKEIDGWDKPTFNDDDWLPVTEREEVKREMDGQVMEPVRKLMEIQPKTVTEPLPGKWTYDLGQNMVGVVRLKVSAPAGTRITLRHAEMLNPDGTIYTANLRSAASVDTYVCKGAGEEIWQPGFTFHGFRYVELTGVSAQPGKGAVTGIVYGSDTPVTGEFACSDGQINQLQSNIIWGQRGNYLSVPTDCPQRDERLGWMGDAQVFVRTATYNSDVAAFFTKWLVDVTDSQDPAGRFGDVAPLTAPTMGAPAWGDAGVICPWTIYQAYGDLRLLERQYPSMVAWVAYCKRQSPYGIRSGERGNDYGDWLSIGADTDKELIGTAYCAYSNSLVAKAAAVLGKNHDAEVYEKEFQSIRRAFIEKYVMPDGRVAGNTQCAYLMALKFGLLPDALRAKAVEHLEQDIIAKGYHLSTGFVGVSYLLPELTKAGKVDTAYRLLLQDTFPSWLFSVKMGATTIWERWDGWTPDKGFQDVGMNSFNHYSLGSCGEWLYSTVAGIQCDPAAPGFKKTVIRPIPGVELREASGQYRSIHGLVTSAWSSGNGNFTLTTTVPANTTATVHLPAKDVRGITESGKPVEDAEGVKFLRMEEGAAVFAVDSGRYQFSSDGKAVSGNDKLSRPLAGGAKVATGTLLANDGDGRVFRSAGELSLQGASIAVRDGSVFYQPRPGMNGPDRFTYTTIDRAGGIATRTVEVSVIPDKDTAQGPVGKASK